MSEQVSHTEAVLAFIYETKAWRDMHSDERLAWCQRVAYVLAPESDGQFGEWSMRGLAPILGVDRQTLANRLAWSERLSGGDHSQAVMPGGRKPEHQVGDARRAFANPDISAAMKKDLISELADTPEGRKALIEAIAEDEELVRHLNRRADVIRREPIHVERPDKSLDQKWEEWLSRLNSLFIDGARLHDETSTLDGFTVHATLAYDIYERLVEKIKTGEVDDIDVEFRRLVESV